MKQFIELLINNKELLNTSYEIALGLGIATMVAMLGLMIFAIRLIIKGE